MAGLFAAFLEKTAATTTVLPVLGSNVGVCVSPAACDVGPHLAFNASPQPNGALGRAINFINRTVSGTVSGSVNRRTSTPNCTSVEYHEVNTLSSSTPRQCASVVSKYGTHLPDKYTKKFKSALIALNKRLESEREKSQRFQKGKMRFDQHNKSFPVPIDKENWMLGIMHAKFDNGQVLRICTVSGGEKLSKAKRSNDRQTKNGTYEEVSEPIPLHLGEFMGYTFVDPGFPSGEVINVFTGESTGKAYTTSCALQKLYYVLAKIMKKNPKLKLQRKNLLFAEVYSQTSETLSNTFKYVNSCPSCVTTLPFLFDEEEVQKATRKIEEKNKKHK